MKTSEALKIIGGSLSKPSKMPGWSIGLPAKECKTGGKLQQVKGSVCYDCYALKGCYVFKVVQDAQYRRLAALQDPQWVQAMTSGSATPSNIQAQRDAIPPMVVNKMNLISDALKVELKQLINEVLDDRIRKECQ